MRSLGVAARETRYATFEVIEWLTTVRTVSESIRGAWGGGDLSPRGTGEGFLGRTARTRVGGHRRLLLAWLGDGPCGPAGMLRYGPMARRGLVAARARLEITEPLPAARLTRAAGAGARAAHRSRVHLQWIFIDEPLRSYC